MCFPNKHARVPVCGYGLVILGELGIVPLSENVSDFFFLPQTGGSHLPHGPGSALFVLSASA